jgi:1-aminocyclopropane-1-carboxylate deaminase/D-cysteine desulfhydrase-like pyridoxal-dependent ACC family enzyme
VLGAELHFAGADDWSVLEAASIRLASELTAQGRHVLTIPIGGSTPSGALGFVAAYLELLDQIEQFGITDATIVHATSTGETQAGLDYAPPVLGSALSSILWSIRPRFRIAAPA